MHAALCRIRGAQIAEIRVNWNANERNDKENHIKVEDKKNIIIDSQSTLNTNPPFIQAVCKLAVVSDLGIAGFLPICIANPPVG